MNNVFESIKKYSAKWVARETRKLNDAELAAVDHIEVKAGPYGISMCFFMKQQGEYSYISLDNNSPLGVGDTVDPKRVILKTLVNIGDPKAELGAVTLRADVAPMEEAKVATDFNNPFGL